MDRELEALKRISNQKTTFQLMMESNEPFRNLMETNKSFKNTVEGIERNKEYLSKHPDQKQAVKEMNDFLKNKKTKTSDNLKDFEEFKRITAETLNTKKNVSPVNKPMAERKPMNTSKDMELINAVLEAEGLPPIDIQSKPQREASKEVKNVSTSTSSAGYLVPQGLEDMIIAAMKDNSTIMSLAHLIEVKGKSTRVPVDTGDVSSSAGWLSEESNLSEFSPVVGTVNLVPAKMGTLTLVSEELYEDSSFNLAEYLESSAGTYLSSIAEQEFINGTTSGLPTGVIGASAFGITSSVTASFNGSDLVKLYSSVKQKYRKNASWIVSEKAMETILTLQGAEKYFTPATAPGHPDMLIGKPVYVSEAMADPATGEACILFGDFKYYKVGYKQIKVQALTERYADNGQVGYTTTTYVDGNLAVAEAIKHMVAL
jgi:HK97 family phage major capsid protein